MAITISFITEGEKLIPTSKPIIASGDRDTVTISVAFDSSWDGYAKSGVFLKKCDKDHNVYEAIMDSNNSCIIPHEALDEAGTTYIGIRGVNNEKVYTSSLVAYRIDPGAPEGTTATVPPTASVYQQLLTANAVLSSRVDEIASLPEGGTSGDAELRDIRVKADGSIAATAGNAVREQVSQLSESITEISDVVNQLEDISIMVDEVRFNDFESGYYSSVNGKPMNNNSFARFVKRKIPKSAKRIMVHLENVSDDVNVQMLFWNDKGEYIGNRSGNNDYAVAPIDDYDSCAFNIYYDDRREVDIPSDSYVRVNYISYNDGGYITDDKISDFVRSEFVDTTSGTFSTSKAYQRTRKRYRVKPNCFYKMEENIIASLVFFDKNMNYLGGYTMRHKDYKAINEMMSPNDSYYAFVNVDISSSIIDSIKIYEIDSKDVSLIGYPFEDENYIFMPNYWCDGSGVIRSANTFNLIKLFNLPVGTKIYCSKNSSAQCICVGNDGNVISNGSEFEQCVPMGRIYTIPSGTTHIYLNLSTNIDPVLNEPTDYAYILKEDMRVAVIGDSITWLDNRGSYGNSNPMIGWQAQIRKELNVRVDNYGYSGYPYAEYNGENHSETGTEAITASIYSEIVEKAVNFSVYDMVILFGGANDVRLNYNDHSQCPIGNINTDYSNPNLDSYTLTGAVGGIIKYIRSQNPKVKILLCTTLPSGAVSRGYSHNKEYRDALIKLGEFWSVPIIDLFTEVNISPVISMTDSNFNDFFYDNTHPNIKGMKRIGELVVKHIEKYM